ncbi:MAG: hypothetical protein AAGA77_12830 [Bacteroidota bacterium]
MKNCYLPLLLVLTIFISCREENACEGVECVPVFPDLNLRVVSEADSIDLLIGSESIFDVDKITLFEIIETDTIAFDFKPQTLLGGSLEMMLQFDKIDSNSPELFLQLDDSTLEILNVTYLIEETECCGATQKFNTIKHNGNFIYDAFRRNFFVVIKV